MSHHPLIAIDQIDASVRDTDPHGTAPAMFHGGGTVRQDVQMATVPASGGDLAMTRPFVLPPSNRAPREDSFGTTTFKAIRDAHFSNALSVIGTPAAHYPEDT